MDELARKTTSSTRNTPRKKPAGQSPSDTASKEYADASEETSEKPSSSDSGLTEIAATAPKTRSTSSRARTAGGERKPVAQSAAKKSHSSDSNTSSTEKPAAPASAESDAKSADVAVATAAESDIQSEEKRAAEAKPAETAAIQDKHKPRVTHSPAPAQVEQVIVQKGGFLPVFLGGVAAAVFGAAAAWYLLNRDPDTTAIDQALQQHSARIDALVSEVEQLGDGPDLSGIESAQAELAAAQQAFSDRMGTAEEQLDAIQARVGELEKQPLADSVSDAAIEAYENELKALQEAMATQRAEIEAMTAEARALEQSAQETQAATAQRAAVNQIRTALDTGGGFAPAIAELEVTGLEVPQALRQNAEEGVITLAELQAEFPDAARAALAASRRVAAEAGDTGGFGAFLSNQLGVRSLEPREGDDPDAVLSRAEAAIREGRLQGALAEIEALPEEGRAELSDLSDKTARRIEAVSALQELSETLN